MAGKDSGTRRLVTGNERLEGSWEREAVIRDREESFEVQYMRLANLVLSNPITVSLELVFIFVEKVVLIETCGDEESMEEITTDREADLDPRNITNVI